MRFVPILIQFLFVLILIQKGFTQGEPPTRMKGESESGYGVSNNIVVPYNQSTKLSGVTRKIETGSLNVLKNPSFSAPLGSEWTFTNATGAIVSSSIDGKGLELTLTSANGSVSQDFITPVNQWLNVPFEVSAFIKSDQQDVSFCSRVDGVEQNCVPVSNTNTMDQYRIAGIGGTTSVGAIIKAINSGSKAVADEIKVAAGESTTSIPQAGWFGSLRYAGITNCSWSASGTGSLVAYSADTDCSTPVISGYVKAASTKIPAFVIPAGSPSGIYSVRIGGGTPMVASATGASFATCQWVLSDNTTHKPIGISYDNSGALTKSVSVPGLFVDYDYTSSTSDKTLDIRTLSLSGGGRTCVIDAGQTTYDLIFDVSFSPKSPSSSVYIDRCKNLFNCETNFSAYISSSGSVSGENIDWINGSVSVSDTSQYSLTINTALGLTSALNCTLTTNGNNDTDLTAKMKSSSTTTIVYRTLTGSTKTASDVYISCDKTGNDYDTSKVNRIIGTFKDVVTSPSTPNGQPKLLSFSFGGGSITTACTVSPCTVYNSIGGSVSVVKNSVGNYTATVPSGTYNCACSQGSGTNACVTNRVSATTITVDTAIDNYPKVVCHGY